MKNCSCYVNRIIAYSGLMNKGIYMQMLYRIIYLSMIFVLVSGCSVESEDGHIDSIHDHNHHDDIGDADMIQWDTDSSIEFDNIEIGEVWARPGLLYGNSAVYMRLTNFGSDTEYLMSVDSNECDTVEIHKIMMDENVMNMLKVDDGIEIIPNGTIIFEPGGLHLMLINLKSDIDVGNEFNINLHFRDKGVVTVPVIVPEL